MDNLDIWQASRKNFAEAFGHPLTANGMLAKFVSNPAVTGAYAEAWIRSLVTAMLPQFRVSTGAIIKPMDKRKGLRAIPQCDVIIWDPSELPALFVQGDFALVPYRSARAIIEVKRTCKNLASFRKQLQKQQKYLMHEWRSHVLGVVISHQTSLFQEELKSGWLSDRRWLNNPIMTRLLSANSKETDVNGVFVFIDFLSQVAKANYIIPDG